MAPYRFYPPNYPVRVPFQPFSMMPPPVIAPPSRIDSFLQSTGQLMKAAETYAPYVQQAMPMFKNLPALISLYKGFQSTPTPDERPKASRAKSTAPARKPIKSKPSLPKIYQP